MHTIEPSYTWQHLYDAAADPRSPFYGRVYHESLCTNTIYNYYIHPQWDEFGSETLYMKLLYTDYNQGFCIVELLGEWNDCLYNDIMYLKREFADVMIKEGIRYFIFICENVLNFHASDTDYYQEWVDDIEHGWIALLNIRPHVYEEFRQNGIGSYVNLGRSFNSVNWRTLHPRQLYQAIQYLIQRRLHQQNQPQP